MTFAHLDQFINRCGINKSKTELCKCNRQIRGFALDSPERARKVVKHFDIFYANSFQLAGKQIGKCRQLVQGQAIKMQKC